MKTLTDEIRALAQKLVAQSEEQHAQYVALLAAGETHRALDALVWHYRTHDAAQQLLDQVQRQTRREACEVCGSEVGPLMIDGPWCVNCDASTPGPVLHALAVASGR